MVRPVASDRNRKFPEILCPDPPDTEAGLIPGGSGQDFAENYCSDPTAVRPVASDQNRKFSEILCPDPPNTEGRAFFASEQECLGNPDQGMPRESGSGFPRYRSRPVEECLGNPDRGMPRESGLEGFQNYF